MKRIVIVVATVIGGIALLGAGIAVGSKIGQEQALVAAADAQGPWTDKDSLILPAFSEATQQFEESLEKARKGKKVGDELTRQAVIVLRVERSAEGEMFKEAVGDAGSAMLLLSAGIIADDGATVEEGIEAYRKSQEKLLQLSEDVRARNGEESDSGAESEGDAPAEDQPAEDQPAEDQPAEE